MPNTLFKQIMGNVKLICVHQAFALFTAIMLSGPPGKSKRLQQLKCNIKKTLCPWNRHRCM